MCMHIHMYPHTFVYMHIHVLWTVHFCNQHPLLTRDAIRPVRCFTFLNAQEICKRRELSFTSCCPWLLILFSSWLRSCTGYSWWLTYPNIFTIYRIDAQDFSHSPHSFAAFPQAALRFDHQPCLLIVADFLRGDGSGDEVTVFFGNAAEKWKRNLQNHITKLKKCVGENSSQSISWDEYDEILHMNLNLEGRQWLYGKVPVVGYFIPWNHCFCSEKLQSLCGYMTSACSKPPHISISHSIYIANMSS